MGKLLWSLPHSAAPSILFELCCALRIAKQVRQNLANQVTKHCKCAKY